jgi:class 3 adenylate cyclase
MINQFLEISSHILSQNGGEVTKFIGDSVLAYFDPLQADAAVQTSLEILAEIEKIRHAPSPNNLLHLLYCGIGLSKGEVIEGNFGSSVKTDYTIMGDPVNIAARLEGLTRQVKKSLILSTEVKHCLQKDWPIVKLGAFALKGKNMQVEAYTLDDPLVDQSISHEQIVNELSQI